jgi:F-type H+-transporting ATPase subunit b
MFLYPHLGTIIWLVLIFGLFLLILSKFAWKPLLIALSHREQSVADSLNAAEEAELRIAAIKATQTEAIEIVRLKKENLIKEGNEQAEKIIALAKEKAQVEADKIISEAKKRMEIEREASINQLKDQIALLSIEIATKIVSSDMEDRKRQEKLVSELINEVDLN